MSAISFYNKYSVFKLPQSVVTMGVLYWDYKHALFAGRVGRWLPLCSGTRAISWFPECREMASSMTTPDPSGSHWVGTAQEMEIYDRESPRGFPACPRPSSHPARPALHAPACWKLLVPNLHLITIEKCDPTSSGDLENPIGRAWQE